MEKEKVRGMVQYGLIAVILVFAVISLWPAKEEKNVTVKMDDSQIKYTGDVKKQKFNGPGELTYGNGDHYKGNFSEGRFDGKGEFYSKDGWNYKGEFKKGIANGQGVLKLDSGSEYKGQFKNGEFVKK